MEYLRPVLARDGGANICELTFIWSVHHQNVKGRRQMLSKYLQSRLNIHDDRKLSLTRKFPVRFTITKDTRRGQILLVILSRIDNVGLS